MNDFDADKILGKYRCAICEYRNHSEIEIQKHIFQFHPNLKEELSRRYNDLRGL